MICGNPPDSVFSTPIKKGQPAPLSRQKGRQPPLFFLENEPPSCFIHPEILFFQNKFQ
jgi:hypothetical protein